MNDSDHGGWGIHACTLKVDNYIVSIDPPLFEENKNETSRQWKLVKKLNTKLPHKISGQIWEMQLSGFNIT